MRAHLHPQNLKKNVAYKVKYVNIYNAVIKFMKEKYEYKDIIFSITLRCLKKVSIQ